MEVWVIEWSQPCQQEFSSTVWDSKENALQSICAEILINITNDWDLSDSNSLFNAKEINMLIATNQYYRAMNCYNDFESDSESEYRNQYSISKQNINDLAKTPCLLSFSDEDEDSADEDEGNVDDADFEEVPYLSTIPGANCRGPCGIHSEYAYADHKDGTHVCYQCKMKALKFYII